MNYEKIITDLGNKIAQLTINESILLARVQEEMDLKEEVEKKYTDAMRELENYRHGDKIVNAETPVSAIPVERPVGGIQ